MKKDYAIYKGDTFITVGSIAECADFLGVEKQHIWNIASEKYHKRYINTNSLLAFAIDDEID